MSLQSNSSKITYGNKQKVSEKQQSSYLTIHGNREQKNQEESFGLNQVFFSFDTKEMKNLLQLLKQPQFQNQNSVQKGSSKKINKKSSFETHMEKNVNSQEQLSYSKMKNKIHSNLAQLKNQINTIKSKQVNAANTQISRTQPIRKESINSSKSIEQRSSNSIKDYKNASKHIHTEQSQENTAIKSHLMSLLKKNASSVQGHNLSTVDDIKQIINKQKDKLRQNYNNKQIKKQPSRQQSELKINLNLRENSKFYENQIK